MRAMSHATDADGSLTTTIWWNDILSTDRDTNLNMIIDVDVPVKCE